MPTYQYRSTSCGHDVVAVQKFSDASLTECPSCEGPLRKVFNAVGVVFKGSGFYRTDSRKGNGDGDSSNGSKDSGKDGGAAQEKVAGKDKDGGGTKESTPAKESKPAKQPVASGTSSTGGSSST